MKTVITAFIPLIIFIFLMNNNANAWYMRTTWHGGPNGFSSTTKEIDNQGNTKITCKDPGYCECPTIIAGGNQNIDEEIQARFTGFATAQIESGNYSGKTSDGSYLVSWLAEDNQCVNSTISILGINEILPK